MERLFAVYMVSGQWQIIKLLLKQEKGIQELQTLCFPVSSSSRSSANVQLTFYCWEAADVHSLAYVPSSELLQQQNYLNNIRYKYVDFFALFIKS